MSTQIQFAPSQPNKLLPLVNPGVSSSLFSYDFYIKMFHIFVICPTISASQAHPIIHVLNTLAILSEG
jgi:hypothetical protein